MALRGIRIADRAKAAPAISATVAAISDGFSAHAGGWQLEGEPYTVAEGSKFQWFRSRIVGGRTNHYGRISLRYADYDLKPYSRDGIGTDWPISYDDISPYYDKAEKFHRRDRIERRNPQRAGWNFPAVPAATRA